jgi:hypothetical protein
MERIIVGWYDKLEMDLIYFFTVLPTDNSTKAPFLRALQQQVH